MAGKAIEINDNNFESEVVNSPIPVLVDFWATWCGPCIKMGPIVETIAEEFDGKVKVGKVNVDDNPKVSMQFRITSIPTIMLFKNGQKVSEMVGARPKEFLADMINKAL